MNRKTLLLTASLILSGGMALAQINLQALADSYLAQGYCRVEIMAGPNGVKVEAIKGMTEVEVVYDRVSGAILSSETGGADLRDLFQTGVSIRERDRDALRRDAEDDGDDRGRRRGSDDD